MDREEKKTLSPHSLGARSPTELRPLTLFRFFFKRFFIYVLFFVCIGQVFLGGDSPTATASVREITLFPDVDIGAYEQSDDNTSFVRIGLTESILNIRYLPCFITFNQFPLLYGAVQVGPSCTFSPWKRHAMLVEFYPEIDFNSRGNQYNFIFGFGDRFYVSPNNEKWSVYLRVRYKFWDPAFNPPSENVSTNEILQLWGNVFDSNLTIGALYTEHTPENRNANYSAFIYFRQSIPLEWRQIGGQKYTAPLQYQQMGVSFRKKYHDTTVLGIGVSYWNLTLDGLRISGPLPDFYAALDF